MASITTRSNGRLQASILVNGKRHRKDFSDKFQAESWIAEMEKQKTPKPQPNTFLPSLSDNQQAKTWNELLGAVFHRVWKGTKGEKTAVLNAKNVVEFFGKNEPYNLTTIESVDAFVRSLESAGNGDATVNRKLAALSKMLQFAKSRGWIEKIPHIEKKREPQNRLRWLDDKEESELINWFSHLGRQEMADLCLFLVDTGARVSEALTLSWKDIDIQQKLATFWETKNGTPRSIPLTTRVVEMLNLRKASTPDEAGPFSSVKQSHVNHSWVVVRSKMGLDKDSQFVPHALRHTCASRLVQRGVPILTVKEWLGHKSLAVTLRYAHLAPKQLFDAVKVLEKQSNQHATH